MNNSLKKRLLSVVMAAVMVFSMLPTTAWAAMVENRSAAGQTRTEQKKDGSDAYAVTQDAENGVTVRAGAAVRAGAVREVLCLDTTKMKDVTHQLDSDGGWHWVPAPANCLTLKNVQINASGGNALILPDGATVVVEGDCVIEGGADSAVWSKGKVSVELEQDASLTVNGLGWYAQGNMTVTRAYDAYTGGELIVNFKGNKSGGITRGAAINMGSNTLYVEKGMKVTADGGSAVKDGKSYGVRAGTVIVENGGTLIADGGSASNTDTSYGISAFVNVDNGTIIATGGKGAKSFGISSSSLTADNGAVITAAGGEVARDVNASIVPLSVGISVNGSATLGRATVNANGGVAPCGTHFASVGLQMTSGSKLTVNSGGVVNANGGQLTTGSSTNEKNGFSAGINMAGAGDADLLVNGTGSVTAIGNPERTDGETVKSYGVNWTDIGLLTIALSDAASFKAAGGTAASRVRFTPDTVSIKGSATYNDFVNVTDGYTFQNSTYIKNNDLYDLAKSLVVTVCDHSAGFTDGKCNNCGYQCPHTGVDADNKCSTCGTQMAAKVTASGKDTLYTTIDEAMAAAFGHSDATVTLLADAVVTEATFTGNATVVLEMGDYTLGGSFTLENGASLAISKDNGAAGKLTANIKVDTSVLTLIEDASPAATTSVVALHNTATLDCQSTDFGGTVELYSGAVELRGGNTPCTFARIVNKTDSPICLYDIVGTGKAVLNSHNSMLTRAGATLEANSAAAGARTIRTCTHPSDMMTDGKCICGYNCPHDTINNETGKCNTCGKQVRVVKVTQNLDETAFYATLQEAVDAAASAAATDGWVITLLDNVDLGVDCVEIRAGVFNLNLGGYTLSGERAYDGVLNVLGAGADVTVRNGAIVNTHDGGKGDANGIYVKRGVLSVPQDGSLTVTGGDQSGSFGSGAAVYADGGMLYIQSGTFNGRLEVHNTGTSVHLQGGTFTEGVHLYHNITPYSILDDGYTFIKTADSSVIDLSDESLKSGSEWELTESVTVTAHTHDFTNGGVCACGMSCTHEGGYNEEGKCTVCGAEAAMKLTQTDGTVTYGSYLNMWAFLQDGANQPVSGTLTLLDNVSFDKKNQHGMLWISGDLTLDLNGKTLSCTAENENFQTLTLSGTTEGSTMTIIDSKGTGTSTVTLSPAGPMTLVIKSGTFESPHESGYAAVVNATSNGAKLRIEGGTFDSVYGLKSADGTLELAGGTITGSLWSAARDDLRELLAEGYIYQLNGESLRRDDARLNPAKSLRGIITVVQCAHESMTGGVCDYCGAAYEATVTDAAGEITSYQTFEEAVAAAADLNGCTVKLLTDVAVEADYTIGEGTFTIDFNGKRLTVDERNLLVVSLAVVTLTDSAAIQLSQSCVPNAVEGGRIIVNSGKFAGGIVQQPQGTLLLNGGYFGMITLWDENGDGDVMDLLGTGKVYQSITDLTYWPDDDDADKTSAPGQKRLHEVQVVDAPLSITRQAPASGSLTVYETSPVKPDLKVVATYDATMGGNVTAVLRYRASGIDLWTTADAPEVDDKENGTVTVTSKTELQNGQYQFLLTYRGYQVESRDFTVVLDNCTHPDIDANGKCGTCQHQFVATLTAPDRTVTGYTTLGEALAAVETHSADAQDATKYTVKVYKDVTEDVSIIGGKFTLDLNGKSVGDFDTSDRTAFVVSGSAEVILTGGEVSCDTQVKDTAHLTVNGTTLSSDVELYDSAKLTANNVTMGDLTMASPTSTSGVAATVTGGTMTRITMRGGTVELIGSVTVKNEVEVRSGGVLTVTAQSGQPRLEEQLTIRNGGKLVASAGTFNGRVTFNTGAMGELSGGMYGYLACGRDKLLKDMLKTGYAFYAGTELENGYVTTLEGHAYEVKSHPSHRCEWNTTTHEKRCGCGLLEATDFDAPVIGFLNGAKIETENGQKVMDVTDNVSYTVTDANRVSVTVSYDNGAPEEVIPTAGNRYDLSLNKGDGKLVTITATDDAGNVTTVTFTLYRLVEMRVIDHEGVAVADEYLTKMVRNGQTYTLRVTMLPGYTGAGGLELEQGLLSKRPFTGNDADGYTIQVTADFNNSLLNILNAYDNTHPTAEIAIQSSKFNHFMNRITFGLFFKETQTVNVTAADVGAGLDKVEYLLSGTAFTDETAVANATGWTALTLNADGAGSFPVDPNSKSFIYVKATDKGGNVTVINADGVVIYTDAQPITERINFTRTSTEDSVFYVRDNGNTVKSITMGTRELAERTDYRVGTSADGQLPIYLTNSFLQALTAGSYTLTVTYNPLGETYVSGGVNQTPAATTVVLSVGKATVDATIASMDKTYDSQPVTPSATTESDGAMTWEFKPDGADPSAYTTTAPEDAGTYNVRLTVAETDRYNRIEIEKTATFTITPKDLTLHTPALENKTYDGNTSIVCSYYDSERAMVGKISGDDLSVVMGQANADSPDVGYRTVTFTGFGLTGDDASNYSLTGQPISGSAEITVRTLTIAGLTVSDKLYDGLNTAAIEGTPTLVNLVDGETLTLRCGTPAFDTVAVGDNIPVSFTEFTIADTATGKAGNYSLTQPTGITASIRAYVATGAEYTATTGEWTNQDFVVTAADGWQVSTTNTANGDWRDGLTRSDETGTGSLTFYVKNAADGYISEAIALTYKIDKTNPTGEIRIDERNAWQSFWNTISFNLFYKSEQTVTLTAADEASGVAATGYLLSEEDYSVAQLEGMTFQPYTAPVAITPDSKLIAYARITDVAGNVTYLRSDGVVLDATAPVITGVDDGTVYCDSVTFTVTDEYLDTVTVDGAAAVSAPTRTVESTYVIEADSQLHTIVATDRAGNSTRVQVTVNDGHTVGTPATCKDLAVCKYCGESFGDLAPDNHDGLRRVAKVNATSTTDGNIEYWFCDGCGKYYLDAAATREITREDTILPAVGLRIVDDVKVWSPDDKPLGVIFHPDYDSFTVQIDGVTVDPANYDVTTDPATGKLIVTFRTPFLRTLAFGEHTITILSNDGSASVSFKVDRAYANAPDGKTGGKGESGGKDGKDGVKSAGTGDSFPMGSMVAALFISGGALALMSIRARRKEEEE